MNKTLNAGLYVRVSTEHQVKEGYSILAQKENLIKLSKQQGWNVFRIYADEGISGKNIEDRPQVKKLIEDIKSRKIDIVALYKFDRLTRDAKDTEDIISLIQKFGVQVITLSGGVVDVTTASGRFMVRISGAQAQFEREQIIERMKFGLRQKTKEGYTLASSIISYGYNRKKQEKEQTINKKEAQVIKRIFRMYNDGKTFTEICNVLNTEKIPTKLNGKKIKKRGTDEYYKINTIWTPKSIKAILTNPNYIGKVRYHIGKNDYSEEIGKHKPIITKSTWDMTQERIRKIKNFSKTNLPKEDVYYCGTLVCGFCGHKLTTNRTVKTKKDGSKSVFNGYRCINREKGLCNCLGISHNKVEQAFINYIDNIEDLQNIEKVKIHDEFYQYKKETRILRNSLNQITKKHKKIMDLFMFDKINNEQLEYMIRELNKKENYLNDEIERIEKIIKTKPKIDKTKIAKTVKEHWQYLSGKERREFLTSFIEKIVIINRDKRKKYGKAEILYVKFYD